MPFVERQRIPVQFGQGINTKVDPKQLPAGNLLTLQNGQFSQAGQINKRFGYDILTTNIEGGGTITNGVELATYRNELLLFDGNNIFSYLPSTGNWSNRGTAISIITEDKDIIRRSDAQQLNPDMGYLSGIEVYAWEDSRGGVHYSVMDTTTLAFAVSDGVVSSFGQQPKIITFQNLIYIFYTDGGSTLFYQTVNPKNPSVITQPVIVIQDGFPGFNSFPYDVSVIGNQIFIGYLSGAISTGQINFFFYDQFFNKSPVQIVENFRGRAINSGFHGAINIAADASQNCWISWANGVAIRTAAYTFSGNPLLDDVLIDAVDGRTITATMFNDGILLAYEVFNATPANTQLRYTSVSLTGSFTSPQTIRSVGLASKAWSFNNNIYLNAAYQSNLQSTDFTYLLVQNNQLLPSPSIIAKETPSVGGGLISNGMTPETVPIETGIYKFANLQAGKVNSEANTLFTILGVNSTKLNFTPSAGFINTVQANTLLIVGGILQAYDGIKTTELGFHLYPEDIQAVAAGSDGFLSQGTYQYQVTYEWTDNNGQIHRSAPSIPVTVNANANNHITLSGPTLRLTNKTRISIVIYRTQASGSPNELNRITSTIDPLLNDPTTDTWSFTDTLSDTAADSNELLYTTGNILENLAPPANAIITTYNNRVFLAGLSDKLLMWYSQTVVDNSNANTIPPQFCAELIVACDPRGGDITALGLLNQNLIIFKEREIFSLAGYGPDATGANSDFADPVLITSDVGCINPNSVVIVPQGLMFQSHKGIYLLDQGTNPQYIGAPVEAFNSYNITSAIENPQDNQIIFTTSNGIALVYDYYFQQWATWTNQFASDCAIYNNLFTFLTPQGSVYVQNRTKFTDGSSPVYLSFTLPNLSFAGLQGFQRVFRAYILGTYKGPHQLVVNVAYDFNDSYTQSTIIAASQNVSNWGSDPYWGSGQFWGGQYQIYEFRVDFAQQKCTSIRLNISDNQTSIYNEGYSISSIVFEVGMLPGSNRLPQTNQYGSQ
jgi:hypothetical protein